MFGNTLFFYVTYPNLYRPTVHLIYEVSCKFFFLALLAVIYLFLSFLAAMMLENISKDFLIYIIKRLSFFLLIDYIYIIYLHFSRSYLYMVTFCLQLDCRVSIISPDSLF